MILYFIDKIYFNKVLFNYFNQIMNDQNLFNPEYLILIQRSSNLSDFVHEALLEAIVTGKLAPGLKLKQLKLAEQLNVSQQTVREALKRLLSTGLVIQKPNRGFAVAEIPIEEQEEIYKIRCALEIMAIETAVDCITDEDIARMRELLPFTASPDGNIDIQTVREANREFHMILIRATHKRHLSRLLEQIWDITWTYFPWHDDERKRLSALADLEEHEAILKALENRDVEQARAALIKHIASTEKSLLEAKKDIKKPRA